MDFKLQKGLRLSEQIFDARYHPEGDKNLIAAATIAGNIHFIQNGSLQSSIKKHHKGSAVRRVRFTRDGRMVTIAKTVKIYDLTSEQTTHTLRRFDGKSTTFYSLRPLTENIISAGDDDGRLFVWDTRTPDDPIFCSQDCDQYISDIDGKYESRKLIVCSSGEGTLTAYDLRAKKMIEPQSELFETGFQCIRLVEPNRKVVVGGEDGAIYIFNQNEWAHTSGKIALTDDAQNRGKSSVDCIEQLPDSGVFMAGCSDGKLRSFSVWPHRMLGQTALCRRSPLESIHLNPSTEVNELVVSGDNHINIVSYSERHEDEEADDKDTDNDDEKDSDDDDEEESDDGESNAEAGESAGESRASADESDGKHSDEPEEGNAKRFKCDTEDYLNLF